MGLLRSRSRSQQRFKMSLNICPAWGFVHVNDCVHSVSPEPLTHFLPNWYGWCSIMSLSVMQKNWFTVFNVKVTVKGLYNQNMTISVVSSKLLVLFATKLGLIVQHHKLECPVEKWIAAFKVKVTAKVQNVSECLSRWYFLSHRTFCYQIWYGDAASWARVSCGNYFVVVAIFKVKVTARAHMIKIWLFLSTIFS